MPIPDIDKEYAKYLASNKGAGVFTITTLEIYHVDESGPTDTFRYYLCDYSGGLTANDENGNSRTFDPISMKPGKVSVKNTTEQRRTITLDGLDGTVYAEVKSLTTAKRVDPVRVIVRTYRSNWPGGPAITPPPEYIVSRATADAGRVTIELTNVFSSQRRCGQYATLDKFPGLAYA